MNSVATILLILLIVVVAVALVRMLGGAGRPVAPRERIAEVERPAAGDRVVEREVERPAARDRVVEREVIREDPDVV